MVLKQLSGGRLLIVLKLLALDLECLLVSLLHIQSFSQITNNIDALNLCDSFLACGQHCGEDCGQEIGGLSRRRVSFTTSIQEHFNLF